MKFKFILIFIALPCLSTTYYVDKNGVHGTPGNDSYSGLSWGEPWATVSKAASMLQAGDSVIIAGGVYREEVQPQNSGTESQPVWYIGEDSTEISSFNPITDYISYSDIIKEQNHDYVYYFVVPSEIVDSAGPLADMAKRDSTRRVNVVSHNGGMTYHRWIKGMSHGSKHGGAVDKNDGLRIVNSMGATYYFEPAESDTYYFSTDDRLPPDSTIHGLEIAMRKHSLCIQDKNYLVFKNLEFWGGRPYGSKLHPTAIYVFETTGTRFENVRVYNGNFLGYYMNDCSFSDFFLGYGSSVLAGNNILMEKGEICNKYQNLAHFESVDNLSIRSVWIHDSFNNYYIDQNGYGWDVENEQWKSQGRTHGLQICGHLDTPATDVFLERVCITRTHDGLHPYILDTLKIYNCVFNSSCINGPLQMPGNFQRANVHECSNVKIRNCLFLNSTVEGARCKGVCAVDGESTAVEIDSDYNCFCHTRISGNQDAWSVGSSYLSLYEVRSIYNQELHSFEIDCPPLPVISDEPPEETDYHLYQGSVLIDAGDPSFDPPPGGGDTIDIGAFEYQKSGIPWDDEKNYGPISMINPSFLPGIEGAESIMIYDLTGRRIGQYYFRGRSGIYIKNKLSKLTPGIYFYQYRGIKREGKFIVIGK